MMEQVPTSVLSEDPCHLGEGPTYDVTTDTAWWFDIREGRLFEAQLGRGSIRVHALGRMASALGRIDAERQLIVAEDGLYIRTIADGAMTLLCPLEADNPATRSNDGRVHPSGTFWIGTMGRKAEAGAGAIYAFHHGEISTLFPRHQHSQFDLFLAGWRHRLFRRHRARGALRGAAQSRDRPAAWRAGGAAEPHRHRRPRRFGVRCRRKDLERLLGREPHRRLLSARRAAAFAERAGKAGELPRFCRPDLSRILVTSAWQDMDAAARAADPQAATPFCWRHPRAVARSPTSSLHRRLEATHDRRSRRYEESTRRLRIFTSSRYCLTVPSTDSLKRPGPWRSRAATVTAGLLSTGDQRPAAVRQLTRALGAENHQRETVVDLLQTIFDGDASQGDLRERALTDGAGQSSGKSRCRPGQSRGPRELGDHCRAERPVAKSRGTPRLESIMIAVLPSGEEGCGESAKRCRLR